MRQVIFLTFALFSLLANAQSDSNYFESYRNRVVLYSDLGFKAAPFSIRNNLPNGMNSIAFKHNLKPIMGIGIKYKWFGLRLSFGLPGHLRSVSKYGRSDYFDAGINFGVKQTYWDIDFRSYTGYVIQDAYQWNDTLDFTSPNLPREDTRTSSFSLNSWHFFSKSFRMPAVSGLNSEFKQSAGTWYLRSTLNAFGVENGTKPILPSELIDSTDIKSFVTSAISVDIGAIPGYAYTMRKGYWQASVFGGFGFVLQAKGFNTIDNDRGSVGIAPRFDIRFIGGFSKPRYFVWFVTDFDNKSIAFQEMRYAQTFYSMSIVGGVRLKTKKERKKALSE